MKTQYVEKYKNKTELEKLKVFLHTVELYSRLLENGKTPQEIYKAIEERFTKHLVDDFQDILDRADHNSFNYDEEREQMGIQADIDALIYACRRLNIPINDIPKLLKRSGEMRTRKR